MSDHERTSGYVQAVPIFLKSDIEVSRYFRDHRSEVDAFTGSNIAILLATEIEASDAQGVADALRAKGRGRFEGLAFGDLPCLWIEDQNNRSAIVPLPHEAPAIGQLLRSLSDIVAKTKDAPEIAKRLPTQIKKKTVERSPFLQILLGELPVSKSSERLIAVIFGAVFVAAILVIALFTPNPSSFQYTIFRIVLALAAAGFVSMTPGFIEAKVGNAIRAGGALAVFVVVYFFAPAALEALTQAPA